MTPPEPRPGGSGPPGPPGPPGSLLEAVARRRPKLRRQRAAREPPAAAASASASASAPAKRPRGGGAEAPRQPAGSVGRAGPRERPEPIAELVFFGSEEKRRARLRKHEAMLGFLLRQVREEAGQGPLPPPPGAAGKGAAEAKAGTGAFARIESFWRQAHMFEYADREALAGAPGSIGYFSVERQSAGGGEGGEEPAWFRSYLIASYRSFWHDLYSQRRPAERHYYELIREGCPCHLYFDLEFKTAANPRADGAAMVRYLVELLKRELADRFGLRVEDEDLVELDSSTPAKFSRHLVVRAPGVAFRDNVHAGAVAQSLVARAAEARAGGDARGGLLFVQQEDGREAPFVDLAVRGASGAPWEEGH